MDRNSAIGLTLIAVLLLGYFYWFSPTPDPTAQKPVTQSQEPLPQDNTQTPPVAIDDSTLAATYGSLSSGFKGEESLTPIETEDLNVSFSNKGAIIKELELQKFKTYSQRALKLVAPSTNTFNLLTNVQGKDVDLYSLYYQVDQSKIGDTTVLTYSIALDNGAKISHQYKIPNKGYEIGYAINTTGSNLLAGDHLTFNWVNILKPIEKDLTDTREQSTISFYSAEDGFDELNQRSTDRETEMFAGPLRWVTVKEKFFLSSIIAHNDFSGGEVETSVNTSDTSVVKRANVKLFIPVKQVTEGKAQFKF
ncbi:MAG TPA: membrane protein insertase YidC, partial [Chryseolinea sp.]